MYIPQSLFPLIVFVLLIQACNTGKDEITRPIPLFTPVQKSGVDFVNLLEPTVAFSAFDYVYFQNGGGVAIADFDLDGLEDLVFTSNQGPDRIYRNLGNLKFEDFTDGSGILPSLDTWSTGVTITDVNADGYPDIYICKSGIYASGKATENLLYVNQGDLTFKELAAAYGLNDQNHSTQATFFDYDQDGDLDAFISNHSPLFGDPANAHRLDRFPQANRPHSCSFYINEEGKYREASHEVGLSGYSYGLGVISSDLDGDGWCDLYVANDFSIPDKLYYNTGDGHFEEKLKEGMGHISQFSMGCDAADIDNDGLLDISVLDMAPATNYRSKTMMPSMSREDFRTYVEDYGYTPQYMYNSLQWNRGRRKFSEIAKVTKTHKTDWSWSTLLADFDNDGDKDQFVTNGYLFNRMENDFALAFDSMMRSHQRNPPPDVRKEWITRPPSHALQNRAFRNNESLGFSDVSQEWGMTEESFSNGSAYADLDNDGDLDLVINNLNQTAAIYENTSQGHYLGIEIIENGLPCLAKSLNSQVRIYHDGQTQLIELTLSRGFQSSSTASLHFGLGSTTGIDSLAIHIPTLGLKKIYDVPVDQVLTIDISEPSAFRKEAPRPIAQAKYFTAQAQLDSLFVHRENTFDDFAHELLLPHQNSRHGPFISVADVNGDSLDDFFVGGASGQAAAMFIQTREGTFTASSEEVWQADKEHEDMQSTFIDLEGDGDMDLYVVSGGNEWAASDSHFQDRCYVNQGDGSFKRALTVLPTTVTSGSTVCPLDVNDDGLMDLFIGGRMKPWSYPYSSPSILLLNTGGQFIDVTMQQAPMLIDLGIVTDAIASDIDGDGDVELLIVGEWTHPYILDFVDAHAIDITPAAMREESGWWSSIAAADLDGDGDQDLVAGNLGLNSKYSASSAEPFDLYAKDFDDSGDLDIVLSYFSEGEQYPLRGKECSTQEMPFLATQFPRYHDFASASLREVYGGALDSSVHKSVQEFASCIFINEGQGSFKKLRLPREAQLSTVNGLWIEDLDTDGAMDMVLVGNMYATEIETPRNDASLGCLLMGKGGGEFDYISNEISGLYEKADTKDIVKITIDGQHFLILANNDGPLGFYSISEFKKP